MTEPRYDPKAYWEGLHRRNDLSTVGQSGLPVAFNRWNYRGQRRSFADLVASIQLPEHPAVFDVGAGTGFWVHEWSRRGARRVDGCDLVPDAVSRLSTAFPGSFVVADLGRDALSGSYDVVSCMNVLLHVTDDAQFGNALRSIAAIVAPGGFLILQEPALLRFGRVTPRAGAESVARPLTAYTEPLLSAGLKLVRIAATSALLSNPIEGRSRLAYLGWRLAWMFTSGASRVQPVLAGAAGRLAYHLDPLPIAAGAAPSSKWIVLSRSKEP